jgi:hypothetical protein
MRSMTLAALAQSPAQWPAISSSLCTCAAPEEYYDNPNLFIFFTLLLGGFLEHVVFPFQIVLIYFDSLTSI